MRKCSVKNIWIGLFLSGTVKPSHFERAMAYLIQDVNECGSNSCRNGGSCTDKENYYACTYLPGFMGDSCEIGLYISLVTIPITKHTMYSKT